MTANPVMFGLLMSHILRNTPRRMLFTMSYYDFAAKIIGPGKKVLDVGCGEGLGTLLLAAECGAAKGMDIDGEAVAAARENWAREGLSFEVADFLTYEEDMGGWDAVATFDVVEHILPENASGFIGRLADLMTHDGVAVIGTPNITSDRYASEVSRAGHVNLYSSERLESEMRRHFHHVFMFAANDEVIHTGFLPMAHYLIAVGCRKRAYK